MHENSRGIYSYIGGSTEKIGGDAKLGLGVGLRGNGHAKLKKQFELKTETIDFEKEWVLIGARNIMMHVMMY